MVRKRRYYRQERRTPVYQEEFDDWDDDDEEDDPAEIDKLIKGTSWSILAFMAVGAVLWIAQSFYTPSDHGKNQGYRVVSVSRGQLHTVDMGTGEKVSFSDQNLVRKALDGTIKQGDVIFK
ncbi:hypothetical protein QO009_004129 [Brevibacillus aydinogluensis]|jgi:hypothetical protein|uniref:hypothetical protein n=1 Tax=Brevibacillus aydinogluensis TaxID=927786 RepID=UPI0028931215|nr:hypothetical protein [Brevibacillus aydinogluensis]MDT3418204.1 hypothetical protein [Brevibacillus aydinogluensis]